MTLRPSAVAAALVLAASTVFGAAQAKEVPITVEADNSFSTIFQASHSTLGAFTDTFTIGSLTGGTAWVDMLSWGLRDTMSIDFTSASLAGHSLSLGSLGPFDFGSLASTAFTGPLTLTVSGIVRGTESMRDASYWVALGGTAEASAPTAPIPEPGTYALMLAGLGAVGLLARRRQRS